MMVRPHRGVGDLHIPRAPARRSGDAIISVDNYDVVDEAMAESAFLATVAEQGGIRCRARRLIRPIKVDTGNLPACFESKRRHGFAGQQNGCAVISRTVSCGSSHAHHGAMVEHDGGGAGQENSSGGKYEPGPGRIARRCCFRKGHIVGGHAVGGKIWANILIAIGGTRRLGGLSRNDNQQRDGHLNQDRVSQSYLVHSHLPQAEA
jgi:hypothetical protein